MTSNDRETVIAEARRAVVYGECWHHTRTGGNDYQECLNCGLMWDYRRETAEQAALRFLVGHVKHLLALVDAREQQDEEHDQTPSR
jgi:hypothetical protein